ncbi:Glucosyl transferase GtrII [Pseudomonas vancouverensis]|nr:Glucosyl transferase GtrII [Pseudomonas vancouverensis]
MSYITKYITKSTKLGVIAGILIIIYPADTMQLAFRALHINWALSILLLSTALFIGSLHQKSTPASYIQGIVSASLLFAACAMYESSLLFIVLPTLIILAKSGVRSSIHQIRKKAFKHTIWLAGALSYIAYVIHTAPLINSYQSALSGSNSLDTLLHSLPNLFSIGLLRTLLGGWYDAAKITNSEFHTYWYITFSLTVITAASALTIFITKKEKKPNAKKPLSSALLLFASGFTLVLLGYFPYLLSPAHQSISQRTFLFASPGGVLALIAILIAARKANKYIANGLIAFLVLIGFSTQLYQFHHYVKISDRQRMILKNIVEQFDGEIGDKTLVVIDKTNQLNHTWMFLNGNLQAALNYVYGHPFNKIEVCHERGNEWQMSDSVERKGKCEETANEWIFHYPTPISGPGVPLTPAIEDKAISKSQVVSITVDPDEADSNATPRTNLLRNDPGRTGLIYRGFIDQLKYHNSLVDFEDQNNSDHYFWGFGKWWSMELPTAGSGWRESVWSVNKLNHTSAAWKTSESAFLNFEFKPKEDSYHLKGQFDIFANPTIKNSMRIQINDINLPFKWRDEQYFEAEISKIQLKNGVNTITFTSDTDDKYYGLSARLDWVEIVKHRTSSKNK